MSRRSSFLGASAAALILLSAFAFHAAGDHHGTLKSASEFASIDDSSERAKALFEEAGKVLTHPRCVNCHPSGDRPYQGDAMIPHQPGVVRGAGGFGAVGMRCMTCHHDENYDPAGVPGAPHWHLAPASMAWEGLTIGEICEQLKDPARNGDRDLEAIIKHVKEDALVAWGWDPGQGRTPAPGDQETFGGLIAAWVEAGAGCPE